jgi:hypothetical protein
VAGLRGPYYVYFATTCRENTYATGSPSIVYCPERAPQNCRPPSPSLSWLPAYLRQLRDLRRSPLATKHIDRFLKRSSTLLRVDTEGNHEAIGVPTHHLANHLVVRGALA